MNEFDIFHIATTWQDNSMPIEKKMKKIYDNKNFTWEYKNTTWTSNPAQPAQPALTDEQMLQKISSCVRDEGFFRDAIDWLKSSAPRKVRPFMQDLCFSFHNSPITYEGLCEAVYKLGFRATEVLERRMILGSANKWVQLYFKDFPAS